jgi:hypothetical protein
MACLDRTYSEKQFAQFERKFKKLYPDIYRAMNDNVMTGGLSPIIFELYESDIFNQVMS